MSRHLRLILGLVATIGLASAGLGYAVAQEGDDDDSGTGEVETTRRANLTPEQQREEATKIQTRGNDLSRRVAASLDEARQEGDIIRVTCVNDKLTQVNANIRTLDQRIEAFDDAVSSMDNGRRNHEFTVIIVIGQKLVVLDREAAQCLGEDVFNTGATTVTTVIDPDGPTEDPTLIIPPGSPVIPFIPPPGSPSR